MAELDLQTTGYTFESPNLELEIFRLVTTLAASEKLAEMAKTEPDGRKWEWLKKSEFPEICRILLSIASIVRNNIDSDSNLSEYDAFKVNRPVGLIVTDLSTPTKKDPLNLREACNKIIHATRVNPDVCDVNQGMNSALTPFVYLYGDHRGKEWCALINVFEFAASAMEFV